VHRARGGQVAGHLPHGHWVAGNQANQAVGRLVAGLRAKGRCGVKAELQESDQASAALHLPDQRAEFLMGGTSRQPGEQRPGIRLANAAEDAVQDGLKRPFATEYVAAHRYVEDLPGCHLFLSSWARPF
jgi:hypothetical protein